MIKVTTIMIILKLLIQIKVLIVKRNEAKQGKGIIQYDFLNKELNFCSELFSYSGIFIEIILLLLIIDMILILLNFPLCTLKKENQFLLLTLFYF
jgi:hypothetical protein